MAAAYVRVWQTFEISGWSQREKLQDVLAWIMKTLRMNDLDLFQEKSHVYYYY